MNTNPTYSTITVTGGIAVPTNPYFKAGQEYDWGVFEQWKQSHTYATNAPDGVWNVSDFGEPEQQWYNFDSECWSSDIDNPSFKFASNKRDWLPFIEQLEKEDGMVREASQELYKPHPEPNEYWYSNIAVRELQRMAFISGAKWQSSHSYSPQEVTDIIEAVLNRIKQDQEGTIIYPDYADLLKK